MRLSKEETIAIKNIIYQYDHEAKVFLFGSRVYDDLKGGDIDLLIVSEKLTARSKRQIKLALYDVLGEQKIDLVLANKANKIFVNTIKKEAVLL